MSVIGVAEAASELEMSPRRVRQLIADGQLVADRIGRSWVIERAGLDRLKVGAVGRPWSAASAWAVLRLAAGDDSSEMSALERSRARRRLADHGLVGLVDRLRSRSERKQMYAHPGALARIHSDKAIVRGGVSALDDHDVDLIVSDAAEVYVKASAARGVVDRHALEVDVERPNVLVHVVDDDVWPFDDGENVAPWPVVAIDLIDAHDERSQRAGRELIERHR